MVTFKLEEHPDTNIYDIKESFEALDTQRTGRLDIELAYTLLLGLGYISDYTKKDEFDVSALEEAAKQVENFSDNQDDVEMNSGIKLETLLTVVTTHPALSQENRSKKSFAKRSFELMDRDKKGYIVASDVQQLGRDVETLDRSWDAMQQQDDCKLSTNEADEIITTTNKIFETDGINRSDSNEKNEKQCRLLPSVFENIFAPPN